MLQLARACFLAMVVAYVLKTQLQNLHHNNVQSLLQTDSNIAVLQEFWDLLILVKHVQRSASMKNEK